MDENELSESEVDYKEEVAVRTWKEGVKFGFIHSRLIYYTIQLHRQYLVSNLRYYVHYITCLLVGIRYSLYYI